MAARLAGALLAGLLAAAPLSAADPLPIRVAVLERRAEPAPVLSNLAPPPDDLGRAGALLGIEDNRTTGKFLKQDWQVETVAVEPGADFAAAARAVLAAGTPFLVLRAPAADILAAADLPEAQGALLFNTAAPEPALRGADCRANLLHTAVSTDMRTDALMQFLVLRKWTRLALLSGTAPESAAFEAALERSAAKFGQRIRGALRFDAAADLRRLAGQELPVRLQDLPEHDVLLLAEETADWGPLVPFNTWTPRPVAGSEGLVPRAWDPVIEAWGAAQFQNRFRETAGRGMQPEDYAAWAAVRVLGEAVTRAKSADPAAVRAYALSAKFGLAAYKGVKLTFRPWNGQLRQPVALVTSRALVATAPVEGFLHARTELDTLGEDEPESACRAFAKG